MNRERFRDAEQMWFWYVYSNSVRTGNRTQSSSARRVCELIDVEIMVTQLYQAGKLNDTHLFVMKKYGDRRRVPNPSIWTQKKDAEWWAEAMNVIETAATRRGWIEINRGL